MRLSTRLKYLIVTNVNDVFGDVDVYLFGSRVDDTKKGGDIDIAIDTHVAKDVFTQYDFY